MPTLAQVTNQAKPNPLQLNDSVEKLPGAGGYVVKQLKKLKVVTIRSLLELIPRRLEDRSQLSLINQLSFSQPSVIAGVIESVHPRRSKRGVLIIQAKISDLSGSINALWFNQRYLLSQLKEGVEVMIFGEKRIAPSLGNPFFVKKIITELEVTPIYPTTAGLYQATIRRLVSAAQPLISQFKDVVPEEIRRQYNLPTRAKAIEDSHFAHELEPIEQAKKLLAFEELLVLSVQVLQAKKERLALAATPIKINPEHLRTVVAALPFKLTSGQRQAAWQIIQDLATSAPMYRLLYGEVGSGKTAVAIIAAAAVCKEGRQVIWLNPTAILATQQAQTLQSILVPLGLKVALVTATKKDDLTNADIVVGTHALLEPKVKFRNLGLIIIDEQHRFGVAQRQVILSKHPETHLLMMSATPIPRTLAQNIFGYLDVTYLLDKPPDQKPVKTVIFGESQRQKVETEIAQKIARSEPGFVICPLIEASATNELTLFAAERKAVVAEELRLKKRFPGAKIGVVHGKIPSIAREKIIEKFKTGEINILLSTTVVEVGIDNALATWILIEEADHFGLAQLHQLRGRVGRGKKAAVCYLAETLNSPIAKKRLAVLNQTNDGLKIAEVDLELRGAGELVGSEQSGLPKLKFATFSDKKLIKTVFGIAQKIIDTGLDKFPPLRQEVLQRKYDEDSQLS